jgi:hypothetical protein
LVSGGLKVKIFVYGDRLWPVWDPWENFSEFAVEADFEVVAFVFHSGKDGLWTFLLGLPPGL